MPHREPVRDTKLTVPADEPAQSTALFTHYLEKVMAEGDAELEPDLKDRVLEIVKARMSRIPDVTADTYRVREQHIATALQRINAEKGWSLTPEQFRIVQLIAASADPHRAVPRKQHIYRNIALMIVADVSTIIGESTLAGPEQQLHIIEPDVYKQAVLIARLERQAYRHELSGLLHRREPIRDLFEKLRQDVLDDPDEAMVVVVMELDLVGLKQLNDSYGNGLVDSVIIRGIGQRLRGRLRAFDIAAQLGGDEYQVIAKTKRADVQHMIEVVQDVIEGEPFQIGQTSENVRTRLGARVYSKTELAELDTKDAAQFVNALRHEPIAMTKFVKLNGDSIRSAIWSSDAIVPSELEDEMHQDNLDRSIGPFIVHLRQTRGEAAALEFKLAVEATAKKHLTNK